MPLLNLFGRILSASDKRLLINRCDRKLRRSSLALATIAFWKFRSNSKVNLPRQFTSLLPNRSRSHEMSSTSISHICVISVHTSLGRQETFHRNISKFIKFKKSQRYCRMKQNSKNCNFYKMHDQWILLICFFGLYQYRILLEH